MPYEVIRDADLCSESKPWAVVKKGTKTKFGCHESKEAAQKQQSALYAQEESAAAQAAVWGSVVRPIKAASGYDIALTSIESVELFEVGMKFPASTGDVTFGPEHIQAVVSQGKDPVLPRPRIKLGHEDPRFNNHYLFDGEPNFGFVDKATVRASEDGFKCIGDLVDVPVWLAAIAPVAWPSRSAEGWKDFESINGKSYPFVLTNLALLGVCWPGVLSLEDLPMMYGSVKPPFVTIKELGAVA